MFKYVCLAVIIIVVAASYFFYGPNKEPPLNMHELKKPLEYKN